MIILTRNTNSTCEHVSSMTDIDKYDYIFYNSPESGKLTNSDYIIQMYKLLEYTRLFLFDNNYIIYCIPSWKNINNYLKPLRILQNAELKIKMHFCYNIIIIIRFLIHVIPYSSKKGQRLFRTTQA